MLMPAAVLVVIVLGAIAVDFAVVFLAERELANVAAAAANDAATRAVDRDRFYADGTVELDPATAARVAEQVVAVGGPRYAEGLEVGVTVDRSRPVVTVEVQAEVDYIFAKAIPGARHSATVQAVATATAEEDR